MPSVRGITIGHYIRCIYGYEAMTVIMDYHLTVIRNAEYYINLF